MESFHVPLDKLCKIGRLALSVPPTGGIVVGIWCLGSQMWQSFQEDGLHTTMLLVLPASYQIPRSWIVQLLHPLVIAKHGSLSMSARKHTCVPLHLGHLGTSSMGTTWCFLRKVASGVVSVSDPLFSPPVSLVAVSVCAPLFSPHVVWWRCRYAILFVHRWGWYAVALVFGLPLHWYYG
mgnify:CR=1 FL=1